MCLYPTLYFVTETQDNSIYIISILMYISIYLSISLYLVWGPHLAMLWDFIPGSVLRHDSWKCLRDHIQCQASNWLTVCKRNILPLYYFFSPPKLYFIFMSHHPLEWSHTSNVQETHLWKFLLWRLTLKISTVNVIISGPALIHVNIITIIINIDAMNVIVTSSIIKTKINFQKRLNY